jgi:cysteinyl-tRNA synthetase
MSKSAGKLATLREVIDRWGREVLLLFLLGAHWRKPIDFSEETMAQAAAEAEGLREVFRRPTRRAPDGAWARFAGALEEDFNTPEALAVLHGWGDHELLVRALSLFGLASLAEHEQVPPQVAELAARRQRARARRDFDAADRQRAELEAEGWEMRDDDHGGYSLVRRR